MGPEGPGGRGYCDRLIINSVNNVVRPKIRSPEFGKFRRSAHRCCKITEIKAIPSCYLQNFVLLIKVDEMSPYIDMVPKRTVSPLMSPAHPQHTCINKSKNEYCLTETLKVKFFGLVQMQGINF